MADVSDVIAYGTIGGSFVTGIVMLIKAGPAWNQSLIKQAREETAALSTALETERTARAASDQRARIADDQASRYRRQLIEAGITPHGEPK